ncbi:ABC transporter permease [Ruminococcus sp. Marseille-P6503]|uniref:ABC transporter permease n=1 Tax=Ruminococcus sp. Marseille-P6503 TaxID=2364796 RepID=UPI000F52F5D2|nr:ABC transporter permease [Ruminococcus sp. Marseille-P6503]
MKFVNLLRKELKEMLTPQTILTLVIMVIILSVAGDAMTGAMETTQEESSRITICDQDNTDFTKSVIALMKNPADGIENDVTLVELESDDYAKELKRLDKKNLVIIPKGFTEQVDNGEQAETIYISQMTSLSTMSNVSTGSDTALALIESAVKSALYNDKVSKGKLDEDEVLQLETPVTISETTVVGSKSAEISSMILYSMCQMQGMFVPIIVYLLIMYSSQMILNAVSTEKLDKTLETLLSAPVSRMAVLSSKMLSAAIVAALYAVVFMFGMNNMMSGFTLGDTSEYNNIVDYLGLSLSAGEYVLVGIQMFTTILISLSISLILGALAKDAKSGQTLIMPIMIAAIIPYLLSLMLDIKTLSPILRYIVYAIPFTHTFMASENIMFDNMSVYWGGLIYQLIVLAVCMTFAIRVFTSDKIFTMSLSLGQKKNRKQRKSLFTKN